MFKEVIHKIESEIVKHDLNKKPDIKKQPDKKKENSKPVVKKEIVEPKDDVIVLL